MLVAVLVSAGNATVRNTFNISSNAWLEIQWYLFSAVFLFCAATRCCTTSTSASTSSLADCRARAQAWIDILGTLFFLLPMAILIMWLSWPVFVDAYKRHEVSTNAGGLIIWPARLMVPIGFFLLVLQGISELIKRIAFLRGMIPDPTEKRTKTAEEQLAEEILGARRARLAAESKAAQGRENRHDRIPDQNMAPLMFTALIVVLLLGYPVAFSLAASASSSVCSASSLDCCSRRCFRRCRSASGA